MEPVETPPAIPAKASLSPRVQMIYISLVFIALLAIVSWSMNVAAANRAQSASKKGIDALSAALVPMLTQRDPVKLKRTLTGIAQAGGFTEITVTDPKGYVLASTSTTQTSQQLSVPTTLPANTQVRSEGGLEVYERAINLAADNPIGFVRITMQPQ